MKRVFVSYTAGKDENSTFVEEVYKAIDAATDVNGNARFVALVDRKLKEGFWRPVLYNWMVLCDAAVILIDRAAPESIWLPREAMVFRVRKEVDPNFHVIPVLRGVTKAVFDTPAFVELGLNDLQYAEEATSRDIVTKLQTLLTTDSPHPKVGKLERLLRWPPEDSTRFDEARRLLDFDERTWFSTFSPEREIAARLLGYGFRKGPFGVNGCEYPGAYAIGAMKNTMPEGQERKIADMLAGYWVDRAAGAALYSALRHDMGLIALRMNLPEETGWPRQLWSSYLTEACSDGMLGVPKNWEVPPVSLTAGSADDYAESQGRIYQVIWKGLNPQDGDKVPNESDRATIRQTCAEVPGRIVVWAHEAAQINADHLIRIRTEIKGLRIVLLCSDDRLREKDQVHYLEPELTKEAEQTARREQNVAKALI